MITEDKLLKIRQNAAAAARRYKRRCWWASVEDMEQEAIAAQLKAADDFDPSRGRDGSIEFGAYTWRVAVLALRRYVLQESSPVSAQHRPENMIGFTRAEVTDATIVSEPQRSPLQQLIEGERVAKIRERVIALVGSDGVEFAVGVLGGEYKPAEVASEHDLPVSDVYDTVRSMKRKLCDDRVLWQLWTAVDE